MRSTLFGIIVSGVAFDADAQAFFTAASITDDTQKTAVNDLVVALKADGIWAKCIAIYPFVGGSSSSHAVNLKNPGTYDITWSGTVTHDSNGITGDGSTGYGNTGLTPPTHLTETSTHLSFYSRTAANNSAREIGCWDSVAAVRFDFRAATGNCFLSAYSDGTSFSFANSGAGDGFYIGTLRSASDREIYKNGVSSATSSTTVSTALIGLPSMYILATNFSGTGATTFSNRNLAFASIGSGLTDTEAADFYTAVEAFQDALSRGVVA